MTKKDKVALELAMEHARREPGRGEQLDRMLAGLRYSDRTFGKWIDPPQPWQEVAEFAAYCAQKRALRLKVWESPPCHADGEGDGPADVLLRKMLAAGVSRWHPDPLAALAENPRDCIGGKRVRPSDCSRPT